MILCPSCNQPQPPDSDSFTCAFCGVDLAEAQRAVDQSDLRPDRGRKIALAVALGIGAIGAYVIADIVVPQFVVEPAMLGDALADGTPMPVPPPIIRTLPPPKETAALDVPAGPVGEWPPPNAGTIRGRIAWQREKGPPWLAFLAEDQACGVTLQVPTVPVGEFGGVMEAVVVVIPESVAPPPPEPRVTPLKGIIRACLPEPRVLAGPPGTPVEIASSGIASHALTSSQPLPNLPLTLTQGQVLRTAIPPSGVAVISDASHPWERITLVALPTALSRAVNTEGFFFVDGVPPGRATVRIYTEATGVFERGVDVTPGGEVMLYVDLADELQGFGPVRQTPSP